ncbi:MAG: ABC transporter permease [Roseobacter sp.]|jgi:peptide/nickel transport system permease protein|uniref:Glutathione transport system permease protein GsiC n=2 Tax=Sulfitobacter TaxID=60136 RepID=A0A1H2WKV1_9RHOB|nr:MULTISPECIES: ABC transporter permease [Sulfitobacter]MAJ77798.1 ABC transporter permease [Roseobacter sp.]AXI50585.1 ABC transporter permease [Sulfitobacter sp. SK025]EAP79484.1 peptide/nickel/opine uptake family ABC transporter, permease protein [Sulfitobacter sp. NAS-14.1]EAP83398.1 peptide/nickel/opine uptake family protein ABC transporter, permease protein [Sulfitobacter sp. EE-36]KAJ32000.1 ABC transporter permease [Sulfitobacter pontiacus 3SOLIMAR09]|tara:strand:+ start:2321 stop:3277 length:957 start_codon:yes stop_codon:yes gene_type:complete
MHPIVKLIAQRLALGLLLLFAASILIFVGTSILPGDVAQSILGQSATPEALANLRRELGMNDPAMTRYFAWLGGVLQGDLGTALTNGRDIAESLGGRLKNTLFLAFWAAAISVPLAIFLGLLAVRYKDRWPDKLISAVTLTTISIPEFMIGYVLIYWVAIKWRLFPSVAIINDSMSLGAKLNAIAIPVMVLTLVVLAHMMRMTRAAILNVMQSAYIETAELKGLGMLKIIRKHAFPNAIAPIVNVVMLNLAYLVVGVVVVEVVFAYPGMGQYLVDHVSKRDVPVVQACGLIFAAVYIGLNLVADIVSILANPRLRHPK